MNGTNGKTILIADDDLGLMKALSTRLEAQGYRCICTQDAYYAMAQATSERPDLLLLDINMPAGTGFSVQQRLRTANPMLDIPVIYITGEPLETIAPLAEWLGAAHVLSKPFETSELLACIRETLEARGGAHQITG